MKTKISEMKLMRTSEGRLRVAKMKLSCGAAMLALFFLVSAIDPWNGYVFMFPLAAAILVVGAVLYAKESKAQAGNRHE
jgi:hypothetical protein